MVDAKIIGLIVLAGAVALTACDSKPLERRDPMLDATTPTTKVLTLGVILSENTKTAVQTAQQKSQKNPVELLVAMLQKNFKATVNMDRVEEAKSLHADLVAVLDMSIDFPGKMNVVGDVKIEASLILVASDGREIETLRAVGASSVMGTTVFKPDAIRLKEAFEIATQETKEKLDLALRGSEKLAEFSRTRTVGHAH